MCSVRVTEEEGKTGKKVREEKQGGREAGPEGVPLALRWEGHFTKKPFGGRSHEGRNIATPKKVPQICMLPSLNYYLIILF